MRTLCVAIGIGLAMLLAGDANAQKKGGIIGIVTKIEMDKEKGTGTITIQTKSKKGVAGKEEKIEVTKDTVFEKGASKKANTEPTKSEFSAIVQGAQVAVQLKQGSTTVAAKVTLGKAKKKAT